MPIAPKVAPGYAVPLPSTKTYPGPNGSDGERTWYGRKKVDVACDYLVGMPSGETKTIRGTRQVGFFYEEGYELACKGVDYKKVFAGNAFQLQEMWVLDGTKPFKVEGSGIPELEQALADARQRRKLR